MCRGLECIRSRRQPAICPDAENRLALRLWMLSMIASNGCESFQWMNENCEELILVIALSQL